MLLKSQIFECLVKLDFKNQSLVKVDFFQLKGLIKKNPTFQKSGKKSDFYQSKFDTRIDKKAGLLVGIKSLLKVYERWIYDIQNFV